MQNRKKVHKIKKVCHIEPVGESGLSLFSIFSQDMTLHGKSTLSDILSSNGKTQFYISDL